MIIEVRCCCMPSLLLGWIEWEGPIPTRTVTFPLRARFGQEFDVIDLPVATFVDDYGRHYPAFKAEKSQLVYLRRINAFREAPCVDMGPAQR